MNWYPLRTSRRFLQNFCSEKYMLSWKNVQMISTMTNQHSQEKSGTENDTTHKHKYDSDIGYDPMFRSSETPETIKMTMVSEHDHPNDIPYQQINNHRRYDPFYDLDDGYPLSED